MYTKILAKGDTVMSEESISKKKKEEKLLFVALGFYLP